ncbi:MAG: VWA domain-containing protein, partial [Blastocatellia bacterium]|nr:VWA domain-containing protein [Blastocatellia bacterium]
YARTLPPLKREPELAFSPGPSSRSAGVTMRATVTITDQQNRALAGLRPSDFEVLEDNRPREIISVRPVQAPVNLVLLLDVSGSIENYVTFIRKAAREFVNTVDEKDRISIVLFGEDVKVLAGFTTDKRLLSESLDTFDAGGATAYYDALGYAISESLRPLKGDRTAIVVLTDGDDNRSFLAFDSLIGAIEESGALIYPLYVPSSLIAASAANGFRDIDPLRNRHLTLTSKANGEGERLAKVSGGVYYPISQLSQINTAYQDIVVQLRTAYDITYRSELSDISGSRSASPRLRIKVKRPNAFVQLGPVVPAGN